MLLHVLPPGFHRIRHYGFLANRVRQQKLAECRRALCTPPPAPQQDAPVTDYRDRYEALTGRSLRQCPPLPCGQHATDRPPRWRLGVSGHSGFVVTGASTSARHASAVHGRPASAILAAGGTATFAAIPPTARGPATCLHHPASPRQCRLPAMQRP